MMMGLSETAPRRSVAITAGLATALIIAGLSLTAALWNPPAGLPLAAIFLAVAYGIHRRHPWSAYGGALLLAAAAVRIAIGATGAPLASVAIASGVTGLAGLALFVAARRMPAEPSHSSRAAWIALAAAVIILPMVCRAYVIASGSMQPTIMPGDQVLVMPSTGTPARGEVVQIRNPTDRRQTFVKRVVAVGGDRVHLRDKQLFVNGAAVNEPYAIHRTDFIDEFRDNFPAQPNVHIPDGWVEELRAHTVNRELLVPEGKFFVLGDNRDDSMDSRYFGYLDRSDITGKPALVYFSYDGERGAPVLLYPSRIRWSRIFKGL
jgi:signal peptidase I